MEISNRDKDLAQKMLRMEKQHSVQVGDVVVPAKISRELRMLGWVIPGCKLITDRDHAVYVATRLSYLCKPTQ